MNAKFCNDTFTSMRKEADVQISMDGKDRWVGNVFVVRLWRSLKYEEMYLKAYDSVTDPGWVSVKFQILESGMQTPEPRSAYAGSGV